MDKNKTIIIGAVIAILAVIGIIVAINMNNNSDDTSNSQTTQTENASDPAREFNPQSLDELSYVATTTVTVSGQTVTSTTESDGEGTLKTASTVSGMTTESYIKGDTITTCIDGECSTSSAGSESATATPDASQYRDTATHAGTGECPAGTCQKWEATGPAGAVTYYIDDENRISKLVMSGTGAEVTYEYKDVAITIPTVQ